MSFSFSLFLPSVFSFPCRRSKGARVSETPCLFGNQTAVFLKCAEIDCALESAKKPRTAGLCGRAAGACDCGPLSCSTIERVNKGRKPLEQGMVRRKNTLSKGSFLHRRSRIHTDFSHIAHKRRNTRFNGLWRVHTPPQPLNAHTAAHRAKQGRFRWGCYLYPRTVLCGSETLRGRMAERCTLPLLGLGRVCSRRVQRACGTAMCLCASLFRRRRGPAGLRDPIAVSLHRGTPRFWPTVITECREKHTSFLCTELFCQLCLRLPPLCCTL